MLKELLEKINSEVMTDEVKLQVSAIFESQVNEAIKAKEAEMDEANRGEIAEFKENLISQIDEYLGYFVEEFTKENEMQIDETVQISTAKRVLENFASLVDGFHLELSEGKIEESADLVKAKADLNAAVEKVAGLKKELSEATRKIIVAEAASQLDTDSQVEKFTKLCEGVEFDMEAADEFKAKLAFFVESVKVEAAPADKIEESTEKTTEVVIEESVKDQTRIQSYLSRL